MNNIKTKEDVLAWAKMILDGKGEKYTPLGKADMFAIAKYVEYGYGNLTEDLEVKDMPPPSSPEEDDEPPKATATGVMSEDKKPTIEEVKPTERDMCTVSTAPKDDMQKVTMTRGYALHHAQFTAQQAYDKFLEWSKEHPKEGSVMDFSTGVKSANAAFAYWLMENIVVEVPRTYARC